MGNVALERLDVLLGTWRAAMRNAWFLGPDEQDVPGEVRVGRLHEAFVVFRWTMPGGDDASLGDQVLVLGHSDATQGYTALYHDERGVSRVFAMTFDGGRWELLREDPDMHQRFVADVTPDRIDGRWEASADQGESWRKDFDLVLVRADAGSTLS